MGTTDFNLAEIMAFRKCSGNPSEDFHKSHCIWKKGQQNCRRCEELTPKEYREKKGQWVKIRMEEKNKEVLNN